MLGRKRPVCFVCAGKRLEDEPCFFVCVCEMDPVIILHVMLWWIEEEVEKRSNFL